MQNSKRRWRNGISLLLAAWLVLGASQASFARDSDRDADDRYVLAATRGVSDMDVHPALKVPLLPVALILDFLFFPFALLADATR